MRQGSLNIEVYSLINNLRNIIVNSEVFFGESDCTSRLWFTFWKHTYFLYRKNDDKSIIKLNSANHAAVQCFWSFTVHIITRYLVKMQILTESEVSLEFRIPKTPQLCPLRWWILYFPCMFPGAFRQCT